MSYVMVESRYLVWIIDSDKKLISGVVAEYVLLCRAGHSNQGVCFTAHVHQFYCVFRLKKALFIYLGVNKYGLGIVPST